MRYTHREWATITVAAAKEGKKPGAWVAYVAHEAAVLAQRGKSGPGAHGELAALSRELQECRHALLTVGGHLHEIVRAARASGAVESERTAVAVARVARDRVLRVDEVLSAVRLRMRP